MDIEDVEKIWREQKSATEQSLKEGIPSYEEWKSELMAEIRDSHRSSPHKRVSGEYWLSWMLSSAFLFLSVSMLFYSVGFTGQRTIEEMLQTYYHAEVFSLFLG